MATPEEINSKIQEEINKLSGQTKRNWQDIYETQKNSGASLEVMQSLLERIEDLVESINGDLGYTSRIFDNIIKELRKGIEPLQFQETLISRANTVARRTLEIRKGESFASASKIQNLQRENQLNLYQLETLRDSGVLEGEQLELINKQIKGLELVDKELKDIENRNKEINKGFVGTIPVLAKMISNTGVFGTSLTEAYQTTVQLGQGAKAAGVNFNTMKTFSKALGSSLTSALGPIGILIALAEQFREALVNSDKDTGDLAKAFNMTYAEASNVRSELYEIAGLTGDNAVTTKGLQESMVAVGKSLGSNAFLSKENAVFMTKLREQAGFANEELVEMTKYTLATGGNLEDNVKNLMFAAKTTALNNGVLLNEKDIMNDIAKTSDAVKLSVVGGAEGLGKAAAQAKALGMSLNQLNEIAGGLLDFESSINNELTAQLVTGKEINLDQARLFALNNDMNGLAKELAKNFGTAAEFGEMNRLQQEAAAKAVGMSREELAKTLTDAKALRELSGDDAKKAQAALNAARARGMTEEQIAEQSIENLMKQQSNQERFNQSVEKLKEIFVGVAQSLMPVLDILSGALKIVGLMVAPFSFVMDIAGKISNDLKPIVGILMAAATAALILNGSLTFGIGTAIALTAAGAGITYLKSQTEEAASGPAFAEGGIVTEPITNATVGEKGREAIIPLESPTGKSILGINKQDTLSQQNEINNNSTIDLINEIKSLRLVLEKDQLINKILPNQTNNNSTADLINEIKSLKTTFINKTMKVEVINPVIPLKTQ